MKLTMLSWNIMGRGIVNNRAYKKIGEFIAKQDPDIFCAQEVPLSQSKADFLFGNTSYQHYTPASYHHDDDQNTNLVFSKHPITYATEKIIGGKDNRIINILGFTGPSFISKCEITTVEKKLRVYNCHLQLVGVGIKERLDLIQQVYDDAQDFDGPVIITGDMNTTVPKRGFGRWFIKRFHKVPPSSLVINNEYYAKDERHIFAELAQKNGFSTTTDISRTTWVLPIVPVPLFGLKLDWMLVKNIESITANIGPVMGSDHRPIIAELVV